MQHGRHTEKQLVLGYPAVTFSVQCLQTRAATTGPAGCLGIHVAIIHLLLHSKHFEPSLALHWETHSAFSNSVLIRPAIRGSPVNTAHFSTGGHSASFILRAVCCVCLCYPFFVPRLLSPPSWKGRTQPPQASIHLPSLTLGEAIKLLLPDLGGEKKNETHAQGSSGGQRDSESEPSISQAKEKQWKLSR